MKSRLLILVSALLLFSGCAAFRPPPTFTTEAEVLAYHGEPVRRWQNDDGTTTLEYSNQPAGHTTTMYTIDQGGIVLRRVDALSYENLARVDKGMTQEEVSRLLGQHRSVQTFPLSGEEVWDWNIRSDGYGVITRFNVHFIDGRVARTSRSYEFMRDGVRDGMFFGGWYGPRWYGGWYGPYWGHPWYRSPWHPYGWSRFHYDPWLY